MGQANARLFRGISSWAAEGWEKTFYPPGTRTSTSHLSDSSFFASHRAVSKVISSAFFLVAAWYRDVGGLKLYSDLKVLHRLLFLVGHGSVPSALRRVYFAGVHPPETLKSSCQLISTRFPSPSYR